MAKKIDHPVDLTFDGDCWRAAIGTHRANANCPLEAILLVAGRAREAGFQYDLGTDTSLPETEPKPDSPNHP